MVRIVVGALLALLIVIAGAGSVGAAQVYLKDGGIIECRSARLLKDRVVVYVNRDVIVTLGRNEVNLKKTFPVVHRKKSAVPPGAVETVQVGKPAAAAQSAATAGPGVKPESPKPTPAPSPGTPAGQRPPVPATKAAPSAPVPQTSPTAPVPQTGAKPAVKESAPMVPDKASAPPSLPSAPPAAEAAGAMLGGSFLLIWLFLGLLFIASFWKIFTKAGEAGWKSLVPIYNVFVLIRISGKPWWWFFLLFVPLVNVIISIMMSLSLAERFGKSQLFGIGLAFFGFICYPILAFDSSTYR